MRSLMYIRSHPRFDPLPIAELILRADQATMLRLSSAKDHKLYIAGAPGVTLRFSRRLQDIQLFSQPSKPAT